MHRQRASTNFAHGTISTTSRRPLPTLRQWPSPSSQRQYQVRKLRDNISGKLDYELLRTGAG
eukprot:6311115-Prymnesium_polylepis.1